jgi:hypothetical protein
MCDSVIKCVEPIVLQDRRSDNMIFCDQNGQAIPDEDGEHDDYHGDDTITGVDDNSNVNNDNANDYKDNDSAPHRPTQIIHQESPLKVIPAKTMGVQEASTLLMRRSTRP